jgi:hypothetical protein
MSAQVPVVDHVKRATIESIASSSPFNIFNIVALVAILVIGFFLYKKFNVKYAQGAIRTSSFVPSVPKPVAAAAPVVVEAKGSEPGPAGDEDE